MVNNFFVCDPFRDQTVFFENFLLCKESFIAKTIANNKKITPALPRLGGLGDSFFFQVYTNGTYKIMQICIYTPNLNINRRGWSVGGLPSLENGRLCAFRVGPWALFPVLCKLQKDC